MEEYLKTNHGSKQNFFQCHKLLPSQRNVLKSTQPHTDPCNESLPLKLLSPHWNALSCEPILTCVTLDTLRQSLHTYNTKLQAPLRAGCGKAISIWRHTHTHTHTHIHTFDMLKLSLFLTCAFHVKAAHVSLVRVLYSNTERDTGSRIVYRKIKCKSRPDSWLSALGTFVCLNPGRGPPWTEMWTALASPPVLHEHEFPHSLRHKPVIH